MSKLITLLGNRETRGLLLGFIGMLGFSQTLVATRIALTHLDPTLVGLGRVCVAALPAALFLVLYGSPRLNHRQWRSLAAVVLGVGLGFPLFSALSMRELSASAGSVLIAILPLVTAVVSRFISNERPSWGFWFTAFIGALLVASFALRQGDGQLPAGSISLLLAALLAGLGYAEGGRLAREIGGWRVICWGVVLAAPVALLIVVLFAELPTAAVPLSAYLSFAYVALISQLFGFFAWYQGLALAGISRVSQLQLLMPFLGLLGAALLLDEPLSLEYFLFAGAVISIVSLSRHMKVGIAKP